MVVLNELKKSIKLLEQATKDLGKISTFGELDEYEIKTQKIVFNLQMQANQVAGELVPVIAAKRTNMRNDSAKNALERIKAVQEKVIASIQETEQKEEAVLEVKEEDVSTNDNISAPVDSSDTSSDKLENTAAEDKTSGDESTPTEPKPDDSVQDIKQTEKVDSKEIKAKEPKVEDGGNSDRQSESNAGDSKPKSAEKTK